jgi:hypothetical protein
MQPIIEPATSIGTQQESQLPAEKSRQGRLRLVAWGGLLLLLLVVVPPFVNINHFRRSIVQSISAGLGRSVHATAVELTLFPRPAFVLHNLTVAEDPAYGAEPVMMAATVTASLRASTLWHRRVEIASLHFDAPSVNLGRNGQGHWNFESLLRNSPALHARAAAGSVPRLPFPYVEATDARINFKMGPEKLPFALEGANLAVWKESGNEWHIRIRARPVRTDLTVADSGEIRGEGILKAGGVLVDSPLNAHLEWRQVELGEFGRLLHGEDDGWRGMVDWTAQARGTMSKALLTTNIQIEGFHRAEFVPPDELDLSALCQGQYALGSRNENSIECVAPLGSGKLLVRDAFAGVASGTSSNRWTSSPGASLQIALQHAPAEFFLDLLRHIHPGLASDASISGEITGKVNCDAGYLGTLRGCSGQIRSTPAAVSLPGVPSPLKFSPIILSDSPGGGQSARVAGFQTAGKEIHRPQVSSPMLWYLAPVHFSMGGPNPATMTGTLNSTGITLKIGGATDLAELAKLAQALRVPAFSGGVQSAHGTAQLTLSLESTWLPQAALPESTDTSGGQFVQFLPSRWAGSLQIHDAALKLASLPGTLHLSSAQVNFVPGTVEWTHLNGTFAHTSFDGSLRWQTPCPTWKSACGRTFNLHTVELSADRLETVLRRENGSSDLLSAINPWAASAPEMPDISGTLDVDRLSAGRISLKNVVAQLQLKGHGAKLLAISGDVFGGALSGTNGGIETVPANGVAPDAKNAVTGAAENGIASARWGDGPPAYTLRLALKGIQPDSVAAIWEEHWGRGSANVQIDLETRGWAAAELSQNATGKFNLTWRNGILSAPAGTAPVSAAAATTRFVQWDAEGTIKNRTLALEHSRIFFRNSVRQGPKSVGAQSVAGTVTFGRILDLHLQPLNVSLTGPLSAPIETPAAKAKPVQKQPRTVPVAGGDGGPS